MAHQPSHTQYLQVREVNRELAMSVNVSGEKRSLEAELQAAHESLEEEADSRSQLQQLATKASSQLQLWKRKYESGDGVVKIEEVAFLLLLLVYGWLAGRRHLLQLLVLIHLVHVCCLQSVAGASKSINVPPLSVIRCIMARSQPFNKRIPMSASNLLCTNAVAKSTLPQVRR